jgi:hypothetical protein
MKYRPTKREISQYREFLDLSSGYKDVSDCRYLGKPPPPTRKQTESAEQAKLVEWADLNRGQYPELSLLHAIPNGGYRNITTATRLKAEGVRAGVPDLCLPVARGGYYGLYIELKAKGGRVQGNQREWLQQLTAQGYKAVVAFGFNEAREIIEEYLRLGAAV